jgi:hypothetical protein
MKLDPFLTWPGESEPQAKHVRRPRPIAPSIDPAPPANDTSLLPAVDDPLRGLARLQPIAIVGSARYRDLAAKPIVYTWEGIAQPGIVVGLTGAPGEGKTTLMFLVAVARASNDGTVVRVLDLEVTPAPAGNWIVLVEAEHGEGSTARKLVKSAQMLGLPDTCLDRVITVARKAVQLNSPEWRDVERMIAAGIVSDVFVDSIARFAPADSNDEREQTAIFDAVARSIEASKATATTFWIVMHSRKGMSTGNTEDISGSTQRGGQVDTAIRCTAIKDEQLRPIAVAVTFPKLREDPDEHPGKRTFAIERIGDRWHYRDVPEDEIKAHRQEEKQARKAAERDERDTRERDTLRQIIGERPGITTNDLIEQLRAKLGVMGNDRAAKLIKSGVDAGWLCRTAGKNNSHRHTLAPQGGLF